MLLKKTNLNIYLPLGHLKLVKMILAILK